MLSPKKIIFLTIGEPGYSRSWTYFNGAKKLGANVEFIKIDSSNLIKQFMQIKKQVSKDHIFVVMSPSQYLVPFVRFFLGKNIVLDAGWSLFEGTVISRKRYGIFGSLAIKNYLIDFTSSHIAKKIILETKLQKNFYSKLFLVKGRKCKVLYTGVDEESFQLDHSYTIPPDFYNNSKIVLFRGKYNPEAGIEVLAQATKLLQEEQITFWVFCPGLPTNIDFSRNTFISRDILSKDKISKLQKSCTIALGQLAKHNRLKRTIPHKAFESAFLSTPYLTAGNKGITEIFTAGTEIACFSPGNSIELVDSIKSLINDSDKLSEMSSSIHKKYRNTCSQKILAQSFIEIAGL
jgi:glycosyltransferase involved in cell wall biosynthesis